MYIVWLFRCGTTTQCNAMHAISSLGAHASFTNKINNASPMRPMPERMPRARFQRRCLGVKKHLETRDTIYGVGLVFGSFSLIVYSKLISVVHKPHATIETNVWMGFIAVFFCVFGIPNVIRKWSDFILCRGSKRNADDQLTQRFLLRKSYKSVRRSHKFPSV